MFRYVLTVMVALSLAQPAWAQPVPVEVEKTYKSPTLNGKTTGRYWGIPLFYAQLWTDQGKRFNRNGQFALSLTYAYSFSADFLARASVEEIARVEGNSPETHAKLERQLASCLVDVRKGIRITGIATSANTAYMFVNGKKRCTLNYPNVRTRFFGIWLAPTSQDPKGAARLRGG